MTEHTGTDAQPYVVVTNSGGVSEIAEVGGWVATLHIDYDECNDDLDNAKSAADEVVLAEFLSHDRKEWYLRQIFALRGGDVQYEAALAQFLGMLVDIGAPEDEG